MKDATNVKPQLGEALRLFRVFHDMSVSDLAHRLDVSPSYISLIENGRKQPNLHLVEKYAEIFETTPSAIMFFSEDIASTGPRARLKSSIRTVLIKFMRAVENGRP